MKRHDWVVAVIVVAAVAYSVHGLVTGTGVVGWLNYAQQSLFGSYSLKLTVIVLMFGLMFLGLGAWSVAVRFGGAGDGGLTERLLLGDALSGKPAEPVSKKGLFAVWLGMVAATWVIGYVAYAWSAGEQREDAAARYEPIVLASGATAPRPAGRHVSLQGRLLGDHVLTHSSGTSGREDYHLVPVVAPGWSPGQPVAFIVKVKTLSDLPGQGPRVFRRPGEAVQPEALLARLDGEVPVPAAQEFRKMGVTLAETHHLVRLVPSTGGHPAVRDTSAEDFQTFLYLCAGISLLLTLFIVVAGWSMARQQRKAAAGRDMRT